MDLSATHVIIGDSLLTGIYNYCMAISVNETVAINPLPGADIDRLDSEAAQIYHKHLH